MLPLIRTLLDILLLRKGPDAIPHSWVLLAMTVFLWALSALVTGALLETFDALDAGVAVISAVIGIFCYLITLQVGGHLPRALQTVSAVIGCSALISFVLVAELVLLTPLVGLQAARLGGMLIAFWSVAVEGHIIARAIERHWYLGIGIAMAVFVLQYIVTLMLLQAS